MGTVRLVFPFLIHTYSSDFNGMEIPNRNLVICKFEIPSQYANPAQSNAA